jgi:hypothetical protein
MKISLKTALLSATLLVSMQPVLKANGELCQDKKCIVKKDIAEGLIHAVTHGIASVAALSMIGCGALLDQAATKKKEIDIYGVGAITGLTAGFYTLYNMPQWTDTYILNKDNIRSRAQNIIVFASRLLFGAINPALGVFVGEMFNVRPQDAQAVAAAETTVTECSADSDALATSN